MSSYEGFHFGSWYLTSATITVSVSSSKLLLPFPELFKKLGKNIFLNREFVTATAISEFDLPVYNVKQKDHEPQQG